MTWFKRGTPDPISAELQDYLDRETQRNIETGMSPGEAGLAARRKLGPMLRVSEETREAALGRIGTWMEMFWRDLIHGARMFAKNPGFTLTAIVSLAFGTGANVAMFSAADALLLRPLAVPDPAGVLSVGSAVDTEVASWVQTSYPNYSDIRDQSQTFEGLTGFSRFGAGFSSVRHASAQPKIGMVTSGNFFDVLRVPPQLGRNFRPEEDRVRGRDAVVVLSHSLWRNLGSDPHIIGREVWISGIGFTVIGVAPEGFTGPERQWQPAFYIPMMMWPRVSGDAQRLDRRAELRVSVMGRLKPGISVAQARAELNAIAANLERAHPDTNRNQRLVIRTEFQMALVENRIYTALIAIVALLSMAVLIVACANVAGLLTSRAPLRAREISLRLAIGAGRVRLIRQLLTESSLIAIAGGLAGLPLAYAVIQLMRQIQFPDSMVSVPSIELDRRALLYSLAIAMGSVILFGLIPAIQTTRANLTTAFKSGGSQLGSARTWGRSVLLTAQVALSLVLLTVAVFSYRAFSGELRGGMGFRNDHLAMATFYPYMLRLTDAETAEFYDRLSEGAASLPGVTSVALASTKPLGFYEPLAIRPEGFRFPKAQNYAIVDSAFVSERYFETLTIPIVRGRPFASTDAPGSPLAVIINETLAAHYWPGQNPLGKRMQIGGRGWAEIVGIAKNSRYGYIAEPPIDYVYLPYRQSPPTSLTLFAASAADSATLLSPLRKLAADLDPNMPVDDIQTMEYYYDARATSVGGVITEVIAAMGLMGLALAMIGLYALMSYSVSRRTREIGVRMAVGADRFQVMRMVVRQGMAPALAGILIGLALSAGAGKLLRASFPLSYEIGPSIYGWVAPALLLVALAAAYAPARRASLVDPMSALREE
jgi:predicted permease